VSEVVKLERHDAIAIVTVNSPRERAERGSSSRHLRIRQSAAADPRVRPSCSPVPAAPLSRARYHRIRQAAAALRAWPR